MSHQFGLMVALMVVNLATQAQSLPSSNPLMANLAVTVLQVPPTKNRNFDRGIDRGIDRQIAAPVQSNSTIGPVSVSPSGWRRTANGWEDASQWAEPPLDTMDQYIFETRTRQRSLLLRPLQALACISPIWIMLLQVGLITMIYKISKSTNAQRPARSAEPYNPASRNFCCN